MSNVLRQSFAVLLSYCLALTAVPEGFVYQVEQSTSEPPVQAAQLTPDQLQQLVAPIALYPDGLIAQILAALRIPSRSSKRTGGCNSAAR